MAKGISIHVGINYIDYDHYKTNGRLPNCVNDAVAMKSIADHNGFESYLLINEEATSSNLFAFLTEAASVLEKNDILFISFSGHGGYVTDKNGDEQSGYDQTLLMYDRMIIDDQFAVEWTKFRSNVRIVFVADSCYSGSIIKDPYSSNNSTSLFARENQIVTKTYKAHQKLYDGIFKNIPTSLSTSTDCSVILLAACLDKEVAGAGRDMAEELSTFTNVLIECWNEGSFEGTYHEFYRFIKHTMRERLIGQQPNFMTWGKKHPFFLNQIPFSI